MASDLEDGEIVDELEEPNVVVERVVNNKVEGKTDTDDSGVTLHNETDIGAEKLTEFVSKNNAEKDGSFNPLPKLVFDSSKFASKDGAEDDEIYPRKKYDLSKEPELVCLHETCQPRFRTYDPAEYLAHKSSVTSQKLTHSDASYTVKEKKFFCNSCDLETRSKATFHNHVARHCLEQPFVCGRCDATSATPRRLVELCLTSHPNEEAVVNHAVCAEAERIISELCQKIQNGGDDEEAEIQDGCQTEISNKPEMKIEDKMDVSTDQNIRQIVIGSVELHIEEKIVSEKPPFKDEEEAKREVEEELEVEGKKEDDELLKPNNKEVQSFAELTPNSCWLDPTSLKNHRHFNSRKAVTKKRKHPNGELVLDCVYKNWMYQCLKCDYKSKTKWRFRLHLWKDLHLVKRCSACPRGVMKRKFCVAQARKCPLVRQMMQLLRDRKRDSWTKWRAEYGVRRATGNSKETTDKLESSARTASAILNRPRVSKKPATNAPDDTPGLFQCACGKHSTNSEASFRIHNLLHHSNATGFSCFYCGEGEKNVDALSCHLLLVHGTKVASRYNCNVGNCIYSSNSRDDFGHHLAVQHSTVVQLQCHNCKQEFDKPNFISHLVSRTKTLHQCPYCFLASPRQALVRGHVAQEHVDEAQQVVQVLRMTCVEDRLIANTYSPPKLMETPLSNGISTSVAMDVDENSNTSTGVDDSRDTTTNQTASSGSRRKQKAPMRVLHGRKEEPSCDVTHAPKSNHVEAVSREKMGYQEELMQCTDCDLASHYSASMELHRNRHSELKPQKEDFYCKICTFTSASQTLFKSHLAAHTGAQRLRMFTCGHCVYATNLMERMEDHLDSKHSNLDFKYEVIQKEVCSKSRDFDCPWCETNHEANVELVQHVVEHHGAEKAAILKAYLGPLVVSTAARNVGGEAQFHCGYCGHVVARKDKLISHMKGHIPVTKSDVLVMYRCKNCSCIATTSQYIKRHAEARHDFRFQGMTVEKLKLFGTGSGKISWTPLPQNEETGGANIPPGDRYACQFCHSKFRFRRQLREHMYAKHEDLIPTLKEGDLEGDDADDDGTVLLDDLEVVQPKAPDYTLSNGFKRKLLCPDCGHGPYNNERQLNKHMAIHKKNLREGFKCYHCDYEAVNKGAITRHHTAYHPGEKVLVIAFETNTAGKRILKDADKDRSEVSYGIYRPGSRSLSGSKSSMVATQPASTVAKATNAVTPLLPQSLSTEEKGNKVTIGGEEFRIPVDMVFKQPVKCPKCPWITKVRYNLIRHLKGHVTNTIEEQPPSTEDNANTGEVEQPMATDATQSPTFSDQKLNAEYHENRAYCVQIQGKELFQCQRCVFMHRWPSKIRRHFQAKHGLLTGKCTYECGHCGFRGSKEEIHSHTTETHPGKHVAMRSRDLVGSGKPSTQAMHECGHCGFVANKDEIHLHTQEEHPGQHVAMKVKETSMSDGTKPPGSGPGIHVFRGNNIEKETLDENGILTNRYIIKDASGMSLCRVCNYKQEFVTSVRRHILAKHLKLYPYRCKHCGYASVEPNKVKKHSEKNHQGLPVVIFKRNFSDADIPKDIEVFNTNAPSPDTASTDEAEADPASMAIYSSGAVTIKEEPEAMDPCDDNSLFGDKYSTDGESSHQVTVVSPGRSRVTSTNKGLHKRYFHCVYCDYVSKWNLRDVEMHISGMHFNEFMFLCPYCKYGSQRQPMCRKHVTVSHPQQPIRVIDRRPEVHNNMVVREFDDRVEVGMRVPGAPPDSKEVAEPTKSPEKASPQRVARAPPVAMEELPEPAAARSIGSQVLQALEAKSPIWKCRVCSFKHKCRFNTEVHALGVHLGSKAFTCSKCKAGDAIRAKVESHIKAEHAGDEDAAVVSERHVQQEAVKTMIQQVTAKDLTPTELEKVITDLSQPGSPAQPTSDENETRSYSSNDVITTSGGEVTEVYCKKCDLRCRDRQKGRLHVLEAHIKGNMYTCSGCDFADSVYSVVESHQLSTHPNDLFSIQPLANFPERLDLHLTTEPPSKMAETKSNMADTSSKLAAAKDESGAKATVTGKEEKKLGDEMEGIGPRGVPGRWFFVCVMCGHEERENKAKFESHVREEIDYRSYRCAYCDHRTVDLATYKLHCKAEHQGKKMKVFHKKNAQKEKQVEELVEQARMFEPLIVDEVEDNAEDDDEEDEDELEAAASDGSEMRDSQLTTTDGKLTCNECDFQCEASEKLEMRNHKVAHSPNCMQCFYCNYNCRFRYEMRIHFQKKHGAEEVRLRNAEETATSTVLSAASETPSMETTPSEINSLKRHSPLLSAGQPVAKRPRPPDRPFDPNAVMVVDGVPVSNIDAHFSRDLSSYVCPYCNYKATSVVNFKRHFIRHGPPRFKCSYCEFKARITFEIKRHLKNKHPSEPETWTEIDGENSIVTGEPITREGGATAVSLQQHDLWGEENENPDFEDDYMEDLGDAYS